MTRLLMVDNYDSFTFNLVQYFGELKAELDVLRNDDRRVLDEQYVMGFDGVVLSPGPGKPVDAGLILEFLGKFSSRIPVLGICLGHQSICEFLGGTITGAGEIVHGKVFPVDLKQKVLFRGLPDVIEVTRYHSLIARADSIPETLEVTARLSNSNMVMAVEDEQSALFGIQFHPESYASNYGHEMLKNFLGFCERQKDS